VSNNPHPQRCKSRGYGDRTNIKIFYIPNLHGFLIAILDIQKGEANLQI
jgi:hypothetical protein